MSEKITGAEALIRALIAEGVDIVFGYPGGSIMPTYNALYDHQNEIKHVLTRHEQGAIHAAEGYARVSRRPGVVFTTSGPGATNLVTGIADAYCDSTPLVVVTGQVPTEHLGFDAFQETDVVGVTLPVSKWSIQVRRAQDIAPAVARAFYIAAQGRPGPVVLDITQDAQNQMVDFAFEKCEYIRSFHPVPNINSKAISEAAEILNNSQRPLIIAGHGVNISGAEQQLQALAEKAGIPVITTLLGLSAMPSDHPLNRGLAGIHGNIAANVSVNKADAILAVGMRFDNRVTSNEATYGKNAKIIHIDIDRSEFDKCVKADVHVHADAKQALDALLPLIKDNSHPQWLESFEVPEQVEMEKIIEPETHPAGERMTMPEVVSRVTDAIGHDAIVVTDVGLNQMMASRYSKFSRSGSIVTSGGLGTMGFGLPAAIGAKMADPKRNVVLYLGDGGLQMTLQELGTILENGTAVKIVLLNNNFLGNVRQLQTVYYGARYSATPLINPDFVAIAKAYGIGAEDVADRSQLDAAIERLVSAEGSYLINVNIDENDMVFPMTKGGDDIDHIMLNLNEFYKPE